MSIKTAVVDCPSSVTLDVQGRPEQLQRAGASLRGAVYRGRSPGDWYRLIPIRLAPVQWRFEIEQAPRHPDTPETVWPHRAWQPVDLPGYFCIRYLLTGPATTLDELLTTASPMRRLQAAATVLRTAATWERHPQPIVPLPADVLMADDKARLLWLPPSPPPTVDCVFCEPKAALYLAPEVVRSSIADWRSAAGATAVDRFALGVMILSCLFDLSADGDPDRLLFRAATGTTFQGLPERSDLPPWLEQFPVAKQVLAIARRLTASAPEARLKERLVDVADALEHYAQRCDPRFAAQELCDFGRPFEALALLQEVFPLAESYGLGPSDVYDLLFRAGKIAGQYLSRPVEAIDFFDRAIEKMPERVEAHEAEFKLITSGSEVPILDLILRDDSASVQLDVRVWRSFRGIGPVKAPQYTYPMARYLNWRRQFIKAVPFIHERLFDAEGNYQWWDFDLNLEYARALVGAGQLRAADEQIQKVKQGISFMQANQGMAQDAVEHYAAQCMELERECAKPSPAIGNPP